MSGAAGALAHVGKLDVAIDSRMVDSWVASRADWVDSWVTSRADWVDIAARSSLFSATREDIPVDYGEEGSVT